MEILLLEDDLQLQESLVIALTSKGHSVLAISTYKEAIRIDYNDYDLAILDVMLPDGSGIDVCRHIRKSDDLPIVFLTANNLEGQIVEGLEAGADDYITKPFSLAVLYARINALGRRYAKHTSIGELTFNIEDYKVYKNNQLIEFSSLEYEIIFAFIKSRGRVLTRDQLIEIIEEQTGNYIENNSLSVYMKRIRDKLGTYQDHYYIETVRGVGYRLYGNQ